MTTRQMLEKATIARANLSYANLRFANLRFANLSYADLSYADLSYADLGFADLRYADLSSADLRFANLGFADLRYADLRFGKAVCSRPYFSIGPIGARCDYAQLWITDKGAYVQAGCFTGTLDAFAEACTTTHGETDHGKEYAMAVLMFEAHTALWAPKKIK